MWVSISTVDFLNFGLIVVLMRRQELQAEDSKASDSKEMEKLRGDWGRRWAKHHVLVELT